MGMILLTLVSILAAQTPATQTYQHRECRFSFQHPTDWRIVDNPDYVSERCAVVFRPMDYSRRMAEDGVDVFTVVIQVSQEAFRQVAAENGFVFDGEWQVRGRLGM